MKMAEYINREKTKRELSEWCISLNSPHLLSRDDTMFLLDNIPAADVAPVVRCRDCKYYRVSAMLSPNKFCFRLKHPVEDRPIGYNFAPDDFCSHGERLGEVKSDAEKD